MFYTSISGESVLNWTLSVVYQQVVWRWLSETTLQQKLNEI